jgi:hypothetical protein
MTSLLALREQADNRRRFTQRKRGCMKAKQSNSLTGTTKKIVATGTKNGIGAVSKNGGATYPKSHTVGYAKNGTTTHTNTHKVKAPAPRKDKTTKGKTTTEVPLSIRQFKPLSQKERTRLEKLKTYLDSLDEDTQISEFEKLPLFDMHWLMCQHLAEQKKNREQPVIVTTEIDQDLYAQLEEDAQTYGVANIGQYVYGLVKATYAKREEAMRIFAEAADLSRAS